MSLEEIGSPANDWNLNIRRYVDNSPPPEPHDVRGHLHGGVPKAEVDALARQYLAHAGYPEYQHALGHTVGRATHDGGTLLGPHWERYGSAPFEVVREGNVYTLEPSIHLKGHGLVSLEEDVIVRASGAEFLSRFPRELPVLSLR